MSPSSTAVGAPLPIATPIAVAMTPSIPLAPRFEWTVTSLRGVPNHSTSRTGIDEATTRCPPDGTLAVIARAVPGSDSSTSDSEHIVDRGASCVIRSRQRIRSTPDRVRATLAASCEHSTPIGACSCLAPSRLGSETNPVGDTATCVSTRRCKPLGEHLRCRRHAELQHDLRPMVGGEARVAQQRVEPHDC